MLNFTYYNPVKIVFGKGTIKELPNLIPAETKVMMIYGGGSIKQNGVYDQVLKAMAGRPMVEFGGIEGVAASAQDVHADLGGQVMA